MINTCNSSMQQISPVKRFYINIHYQLFIFSIINSCSSTVSDGYSGILTIACVLTHSPGATNNQSPALPLVYEEESDNESRFVCRVLTNIPEKRNDLLSSR